MTTNQVIVLMDVHRGFRVECHAGSLKQDLVHLQTQGLIRQAENAWGWELTEFGDTLVEAIHRVAKLADAANP